MKKFGISLSRNKTEQRNLAILRSIMQSELNNETQVLRKEFRSGI